MAATDKVTHGVELGETTFMEALRAQIDLLPPKAAAIAAELVAGYDAEADAYLDEWAVTPLSIDTSPKPRAAQ